MTYEYVCQACGHQWEAEQSIKDRPLENCVSCGEKKAKRLVSGGTGFLLKGGGWYADLYGSPGSGAGKGSDDKGKSGASSSKSDAASTGAVSSDTKSPADTKSSGDGKAAVSNASTSSASSSGSTSSTSTPSAKAS